MYSSRTLQQKKKGKWIPINIITDSAKITAMLADELSIKYIFRQRKIKSIKYTGIGLVVMFDRKTKAVYTK